MADIKLTYTIPEDKVAEYIADYIYVHKNNITEPDPDWEGDPLAVPQIAKYTDAQWVREHIMQYIRAQIVRGKQAKEQADISVGNIGDVT